MGLFKKDSLHLWVKDIQQQRQPPEVFCKKGTLKNFANFAVKHLCWGLFLITLQALRSATLLKRDSNAGVFLRKLRS